jgi:hypothetical protein
VDLPPSYRSFLVRLWRDSPDGPWRGKVESIQSGETTHLESIEQVMRILRQAAGIVPPPAEANDESKHADLATRGRHL